MKSSLKKSPAQSEESSTLPKQVSEDTSLASHKVIVRLWTSGKNPLHPGEDIGHAAIELTNIQLDGSSIYISLWPKHGITLDQVVSTVPYKLHSLEDDLRAEGREPEVVYCFYTLDRHAMRAKFEEMQSTLQGWRLLGGLFVKEKDTAESCASLVLKILQAGDATAGILPHAVRQSSKLSSAGSSRMFKAPSYSVELTSASLAQNPDALVEILRMAKLQEHEKNPETRNLVYPGETSVDKPKPFAPDGHSSRCSVM